MESHLSTVNSAYAPQPIGPYSQAIRAGHFLFCSGQIALEAKTGAFKNESVEVETKQVLENLRMVLREAGLTFAHVVKTTIFLVDMADFQVVNKTYEETIGSARPARSTVAVHALPRGARVEIECIALLDQL